jgi:Amt family ammonium transporter
LIMSTGLGIFYSGFVQVKNSLTILLSTFLPAAMVGIQVKNQDSVHFFFDLKTIDFPTGQKWLIFGYSLVFTEDGSPVIGTFNHVILRNVGNNPNPVAPTIPSNVFMIYQCFFATLTPTIIFGSVAERATLTSFLVIIVFWSTLVYDFLAYWTWNKKGWLQVLGAIDFAGGGPVHIASGCSSLAFALVVGPRATRLKVPVNIKSVYVGTGLLWFGWIGFNGGSELALNSRAVNAVVVTNFAAFTSGICWVLLEMVLNWTKQVSLTGFCSGVIVGLVAITPASGFVTPVYSIVIGIIGKLQRFFFYLQK